LLFSLLIIFSLIVLIIVYKNTNNNTKNNTANYYVSNSIILKQNINIKNKIIEPKRKNIHVWNDAPSLTLICRAYKGSVLEYYNVFLIGYHLFWPKEQWPNSDLVLVLDEESELDQRLGTVIVNLPPYPKVYFEKIPDEETFCPQDRRIGYSRQQYSNFYSDLYTDKEYIGIVDSDALFVTHVIPENFFVNGKPRILG